MWLEWFIFGGTWWWLLTLVALIIIVAFEEAEQAGGAFGILVGYFVVFSLFGSGGNFLGWIGNHPVRTFFLGLFYFGLGAPWAVFWYWWKQTDRRQKYDEARAEFLRNHKLPVGSAIPDDLLNDWGRFYSENGHAPLNLRMFWTTYRKQLTCAMTWWPIHAGSFFLKDFIWTLWQRVLTMLGDIFTKIDERTWGDVEEDFRRE